MAKNHNPSRQRGVSALVVLIVLVMLGGLAAGLLRLSVSQSRDTAAAAELARALDTARSGIQWGAHEALKGSWVACAASTQTLNLKPTTGFMVTVSCTSRVYNEGETAPGTPRVVRVYEISAVSCNGTGASCPDAGSAPKSGYVERMLRAGFKE